MNWGVGVDIVEPDRLRQRMASNPGLIHQLFTVAEQSYCNEQYDPIQHLAARFCAKEAVIKALGLDGWEPLEVEIQPGDPVPEPRFHGDMARRMEMLDVEVRISISHLPSLAVAIAMAVPRPWSFSAGSLL